MRTVRFLQKILYNLIAGNKVMEHKKWILVAVLMGWWRLKAKLTYAASYSKSADDPKLIDTNIISFMTANN